MAWRDSRRSRSRLVLFISSVILGIAALVAIYSLGENVRRNIDTQAATLLGADLEISGNQPAPAKIRPLLDSLGEERSEERRFASMAYFPKSGGSRLAQVRALEGNYPYYGELETIPAEAGRSFRNKQQALVDQTLMLQYDAKVGDSVKVGEVTFVIAGVLLKAPGQTGVTTTVAPAVYIPLRYLEQTGLEQKGSRINYLYFFRYPPQTDVEKIVKKIEPRLELDDFDTQTVQGQKESTGRSFEDLTQFLALVGFIALLLGCVGVASAVHIYIREKLNAIALLRCLGVKSSQAFVIYLIQIVGVGFLGSVLGALLGTVIQQFLPIILKDFLPFDLTTEISWAAIGQGVVLGTLISILFALLPLISVRNISPLRVLRASFEPEPSTQDPLRWLIYGLILVFVFFFTYLQTNSWLEAAIFTGSILGAFLLLLAMASLLMGLVKRFFPSSWSYVWRQALANLHRPNNQTSILIVSIGLGTAFICTLILVQSLLLKRVTLSTSGNQPNVVLFDIQSNQRDEVLSLATKQGLPIIQSVPVVNMRLEKVNGLTAATAQKDTSSRISYRIFSREYRVTFRDTLTEFEKLKRGTWQGRAEGNGPVPISIEEGFAMRNRLRLGDTLTFNVQGALLATVVGSLREVDWGGVRTSFLVLFPAGVLEEAPQFHVLLTRVESNERSAAFQRTIVQRFPNISIIDLGLVLKVLDELLEKIGFVIRFMAGFSILTGLIVLISSVLISKYQRLQESVLLRTIGASRNQIFAITALEYFFLGALAAATGILVALAGSWGLAKFTFKVDFTPQFVPILLVFLIVSSLTVLIGLANSRGILSRSPLEVLRQDG
ncbi:FtsX-like permease family protein [Cytophagaceae bacterium SJW1-29]|uniref:FtsX-like permease family protein n=2 Tax=Salmonirosea aquatica TaxID=2654236 RepID=A0A7C9BHE9_9BACT|nr:FtsX-like permease family protein [Cytophagaceae bacterium SJW1-29]